MRALIGSAEETSTFDFKRELSSNPEIAKDIGAMTVDGGAIAYGVDEDRGSRQASAIQKVRLAGVEEKLRQVIGTRIFPPPDVEIILLTEHDADAEGVVVVVIPPSSLGPHMVDARYPCRRGTTTGWLSEAEVAQLYERRRQLAGTPRESEDLLTEFVSPRAPEGHSSSDAMYVGVGRLRLAIAPVANTAVHPRSPWLEQPLGRAFDDLDAAIRPRLKWTKTPDALDGLRDWEPLGSTGWTAGRSGGDSQLLLSARTVAAVLTYPLRFSFQATWPVMVDDEGGVPGYRCAFESDVALAAVLFVGYAGQILSQAQGVGPVQCAVQTQGFEGAVSFRATGGRARVTSGMRQAHDHTGGIVVTASDLRHRPEEVAQRLIDPWLVSFYEHSDPLWPHLLRTEPLGQEGVALSDEVLASGEPGA